MLGTLLKIWLLDLFFSSFINFFPLWASNFFISFYICIGKGVHQSCILSACQVPWSMGKNTGVVCYFLLQKIFLTQGSNPVLLHCRQILYSLSHQGSPDWATREAPKNTGVAVPSSRGSSKSRDWSQVSLTAGWFFTVWATREAPAYLTYMQGTSCEILGWVNHKLESRLPEDTPTISDMQMTPP